jgi:hypothetical protein
MQRVEELALEAPFKLGVVEIARVQIKIVSVHGDGFILELNDHLDAFAFIPCRKVQQGMFIEAELV